jgi:asparagine synthase (glutamine-hydrolysing)
MCGICGIVTPDLSLVPDRGLLERMRDLIAHRGPDGAGSYLAPGVGLGHRRLSIVDVAHGQQPIGVSSSSTTAKSSITRS